MIFLESEKQQYMNEMVIRKREKRSYEAGIIFRSNQMYM